MLASALSERHLRDAITLAQELSARDQREQALAVLMRPLVELGHVSDALHTVATLSDASASDAFRLMAPAVPASDVNAAAELAQTLTEPCSRDSALAAVAVRAASVRKSAEAFAWLRSLTEQRYTAEALCSMAPHLDAEETSRALDIAASLSSIGDQTSALACLAQNLDEPRRTSVLQSLLERVSRSSTRESERALAALVAYLPRSMLQRLTWSLNDDVRTNAHVRLAELGYCVEVLDAVQGLKFDGGKETIIARIVPFLNEDCLERAMTVATDMSDPNLQAATLRRLLPRMAELGRPRDALRRALAMDTEYWRSGAVSGIAPYLDVPGLREALSSAQRIRDDAAQKWAAVQLSVFAPATLLREALEIIGTGGIAGTQLVFAAERFRQYTSSAHLGEVFATFLRIPNDRDRTSALLRLAQSLGPSERDEAAESVLELDLPPLTEPDALLIKALREPLRGRAAAAITRSAWDWSRRADREFEPEMVASFAGTLGALGASMQVLNELRICDERIRILGLIRAAKYLDGQRNAEAIERVLEMLSRMVSPYDVVITVGEVAEDAPEPVVRAALEVAHTRCDTGTVTTERCYLSARLASFGAADEGLALLQTISDAKDEVKPRALTRVAKYLRGAQRTEVLREAALAAARIRNPTGAGGPEMRRAEVLAPLAELLADVPLTDSHAILGDVLLRLSQQTRPEFLGDLGALAPVIFAIGHTQGIENVRTAMRQTAGWWP